MEQELLKAITKYIDTTSKKDYIYTYIEYKKVLYSIRVLQEHLDYLKDFILKK